MEKMKRTERQIGRIQGFWIALAVEAGVEFASWVIGSLGEHPPFNGVTCAATVMALAVGLGALMWAVAIHDR